LSFLPRSGAAPDLHPFPTRRSSDLPARTGPRCRAGSRPATARPACAWWSTTGPSPPGAAEMPAHDPADGWTSWPAPAKLNLFLRIPRRRPDGYHELQTVFRLLDWGDTVRIRVRRDRGIHRIGASVPGMEEASDLLVRAAKLLQSEANVALGADICVEKRIPAGAGFGGGSSNAATVLRALD